MPTYAYACTECDHTFEAVQSFHEDSLTVCPDCGGRLRKLYNAVGVVFKGSGFYRTDSRGSGGSSALAASGSSSGASSGTPSGGSGSGDSSGSSGSASSAASSSSTSSTTSASTASSSTTSA